MFNQLFGSGTTTQETQFLNEDQIRRGQRTADGALTTAQRIGPYQGEYYAGFNPTQTGAINRAVDFADQNRNLGQGFVFGGQSLLSDGSGIGSNAQAIFDRSFGRTPDAARDAALAEATGTRTQGLIDAAIRDTTRQLTEETLPGIQRDITATGNRNSSRAGAAEAVATRAAQDRIADVSSQIRQSAYDTALNDDYRRQVTNDQTALGANSQLGSVYDRGLGTVQTGLATEAGLNSSQLAAGTALQGDAQARLNADRTRFDDIRFDGFNILDRYNSGIGGPIVSGQTVNDGSGAFQRFGQGLNGLAEGFQSIAQIGAMFSGNPAAAAAAAGG